MGLKGKMLEYDLGRGTCVWPGDLMVENGKRGIGGRG